MDRLIEVALAAGGNDNITALLVGIPAGIVRPEPLDEITESLKVITQPIPLTYEQSASKNVRTLSWLLSLALLGLALFIWWWQKNHWSL